MDRCCTEHTHSLAFALLYLEPLCLDNHTQAFYKEDATKDDQHQFLMDNDSANTNDTTNGQRTGITHKNLGREGIIPKETNHRPNEGREEYYQLLGTGNIHDIKIGSIHDVRRDIAEYQQRGTYNSRISRTHAIHTIIQISSIRQGCYHENGHNDKQNPPCSNLILAQEGHNV